MPSFQSTATGPVPELQLDKVLLHSDRTVMGVGLRAGDRIGGGLGLFLEWSSKQ